MQQTILESGMTKIESESETDGASLFLWFSAI